ncbi:hypothetical protein [Aquimarina sp. RZ0]|uniref:hypothetical protein n=1 Tax=Aquimarina sp. RZ0 TaxID=2607730 RepID=UPI0011F0AE91|nr:hypothetical protein [Aquimarina sp. RZ0]KAA1247356.1 hypothetical protein F0000_04215 [Aquimarina sp. RZ0]
MAIYLVIADKFVLSQILILVGVGFVLLGYSVSYEVRKDFKNYKHIMFFGVTVFKQKLIIDFPEYISVFSASFKQDNNWGTVSAMGTKGMYDAIVVRFFTMNSHFTVFNTSTYELALDTAKKLGMLLNVEIRDTTKNSST